MKDRLKKLCLTLHAHTLHRRKVNFPTKAFEILTSHYPEVDKDSFWANYLHAVRKVWVRGNLAVGDKIFTKQGQQMYEPFISNPEVRKHLILQYQRLGDSALSSEAVIYPDVLPFFEELNKPDWPWDETVIFVTGYGQIAQNQGKDVHMLRTELGLNVSGQTGQTTSNNPTLAPIARIIQTKPPGRHIATTVRRTLQEIRPDHNEFDHLFVTAFHPNPHPSVNAFDIRTFAHAVRNGYPTVIINRDPKDISTKPQAEAIGYTSIDRNSERFNDEKLWRLRAHLSEVQKIQDIVTINELSALKEWRPEHSDRTKVTWLPLRPGIRHREKPNDLDED